MGFGTELAALETARARLEGALPGLAAERLAVAESLGRIAAAEVTAPRPLPESPIATRDGYAVPSVDTLGAGLYSPVTLALGADAAAQTVELGDPVAAPRDTVVDLTAVTVAAGSITVTEPAAPGVGVRAPGAELEEGRVVLPEGQPLDALAMARLQGLGIDELVSRVPPSVVLLGAGHYETDVSGAVLASCLRADGLEPQRLPGGLERGLDELATRQPALAVIYGGSGWGQRDRVAAALAERGELTLRGVAARPGSSAQLARVGASLVVVLPGQPWAAVAAYRLLVSGVLRRWLGTNASVPGHTMRVLSRKLVSRLGLTELVPVARDGDDVVPLPREAALPHPDLAGVVIVADGSEGHAAGEQVRIDPAPAGGPP